jgi:hypothetical protein
MSSPDPESYGLLGKLIAAGSAIVLPVLGIKSWADRQLEKKVSKDDFKGFLERFDEHCRNDREVQAKLFDRVDEVKNILIEKLPR